MLYDYLKAIDLKDISPTDKEHKAMLFMLSTEVGILLASPIVKQKQLAYELRVSDSFLSINKQAFSLARDIEDAIAMWNNYHNFLKESNPILLRYVVVEDSIKIPQGNLIIDGVRLYHRKG